jgi:hypothetical protein
MDGRKIVLVAFAAGAVLLGGSILLANSPLIAARYPMKGKVYAIPYKYDFRRNFRIPWLEGIRGVSPEPKESIWLILPATELAEGLLGYSRYFRGYDSKVEADMTVNIVGGDEAQDFGANRARLLGQIDDYLKEGARTADDPRSHWKRIIWIDGEKGTPGEGHLNFYLMPVDGHSLPGNWWPPGCVASPDINGHERYSCSYRVHEDGITFDFTLREENLGMAGKIPSYVISRLKDWEV